MLGTLRLMGLTPLGSRCLQAMMA